MRAELMVQQQVDSVWQHMVGVICLNLTSRVQVKQVLPDFFEKWPTPGSLLYATRRQIEDVIAPLGMQKVRSERIYRMSEQFKDWDGEIVFMNPPYGREISTWIRKAYLESLKPGTRVVCLIPARTDTRYWHEYCMKAKEIHFVKGRLKFGGSANSAPFPSAVVVFESQPQTIIKTMEAR